MFFRRKQRHPLELEAESCANTIQHQLTRLNLAYRAKKGDVDTIQRVEFVEPLIATPAEIRIEVDVNRLPRSVTIVDLRKPENLETLSVACKCPVRAEHKKGKGGGFWYVVELQEHSKIPAMVRFSDMQRPGNMAPLAIPIGIGDGGQRWEDLRDLPHLLIAGATKQGKSVMVNALLCSLARRHGPDRLLLYLADLKGGMELSYYERLPHVRQFVTKAIDLPQMLAGLQKELDRRTNLLRGIARDLDGYNYQVGKAKALPYIVVVVDEIANAMLSSTRIELDDGRKGSIAKLSEEILADLAARARAVGIHLIISTQRPSVDVVTGLIKANFPCRIAFGTASEVDSRVIVDDSSAAGLKPGRMRFRRNMELLELQGPFLSDADVRRELQAIESGEPVPEPETKTDRESREIRRLLEAAETSFGRQFPIRDLAAHTKIGRNQVEALALRLEKEKILRRRWGAKARIIKVDMGHWNALYPAPVPRPASRPELPDHVPLVQLSDVDRELLPRVDQPAPTKPSRTRKPKATSESPPDKLPTKPARKRAASALRMIEAEETP